MSYLLFIQRELTVNDLKKAFETIDPSIGTQALATYLGQGFQTTGESLTEASVADTDIILDRLQANDVKRIGPKIL